MKGSDQKVSLKAMPGETDEKRDGHMIVGKKSVSLSAEGFLEKTLRCVFSSLCSLCSTMPAYLLHAGIHFAREETESSPP